MQVLRGAPFDFEDTLALGGAVGVGAALDKGAGEGAGAGAASRRGQDGAPSHQSLLVPPSPLSPSLPPHARARLKPLVLGGQGNVRLYVGGQGSVRLDVQPANSDASDRVVDSGRSAGGEGGLRQPQGPSLSPGGTPRREDDLRLGAV